MKIRKSILKPIIGITLMASFFTSTFVFANQSRDSLVEVKTKVVKSDDSIANLSEESHDGWWLLASSDWLLAGPGKDKDADTVK